MKDGLMTVLDFYFLFHCGGPSADVGCRLTLAQLIDRKKGQGTRGATANTPLEREKCFEILAVNDFHPSQPFYPLI
jgi:hypothetical protein